MRKFVLFCASFCAMVLLISSSPVRAQSVLWVSTTGNDASICSQPQPCLTFQGAINKGNVARINCLNSGFYGTVTITASITIDCGTGNVGSVASSGTAIEINTPSAATIILRHLSLDGLATGTYGISTTSFSSGTLIVEDCVINGFVAGYGINFVPSGGRGQLEVLNSQLYDNGHGIVVTPGSGRIATVTLNQVEMVANTGSGLILSASSNGVVAGTMRHSVASGNGETGVFANASQVFFTVEESSIVANLAYGIYTSSSGAVVNVGGSTIGGNGTGVHASLGSLISFGNNQMSANGSNGNFTSTTALQ